MRYVTYYKVKNKDWQILTATDEWTHGLETSARVSAIRVCKDFIRTMDREGMVPIECIVAKQKDPRVFGTPVWDSMDWTSRHATNEEK